MKSKRIVAIVVLVALISAISYPICSLAENQQPEEINIEEVVTVAEEETVPPIIIINTEEPEQNSTITETPYVKRITKCRVNLHPEPAITAVDGMVTLDRGVELEGSFRSDGWVKVKFGNNDYYVYSEFLVTEEEWENLSKIPYSSEVPLSEDLQKYLWNECQDTDTDYCFALAIIDIETGGTFRPDIISKTSDYGMFQCNSCWRSTFKKLGLIQNDMTELLNPYNSIHAGLYLLSQYVAEFGVSEAAAVKYNRGNATASSSTPYSKKAMNNYAKWKSILYPETTE